MGKPYTVQRGDNLTAIARRFHLKSWQDLYNSSDNAVFRAKRPNPNLIFPGDIIVVPDVLSSTKTRDDIKTALNYWRSALAIPFMYKEMINNAKSRDVAEINALCTGESAKASYGPIGEPGERAARAGHLAGDYVVAAMRWRDLVRSGAKWDHKKELRKMLKLDSIPDTQRAFPIPGDSDHEYFYDIWSNIHFGYVGRAAGFPGSILQWGAARGGSAGVNDPIDIETMQIGIDLWDRYGLNLSEKQLVSEIPMRKDRLLQMQETPAYRNTLGKHPDFRHVQPITDGQ